MSNMQSNLIDAIKELWVGMDVLVTHPGPIKERLVAMFEDPSFDMAPHIRDDFPELIRSTWEELWAKVTAVKGTSQSGDFRLSIDALDEQSAIEVAQGVETVFALLQTAVRENDS